VAAKTNDLINSGGVVTIPMAKMNLDRFNLNLFVAFEALSKADTLTQAAGALYVTQSTLSVALRQMREYFDDELFVYKPKQKELTPLAQDLRPRVLEILKTAKATLMLKEQTARFESRAIDRQDWSNDNVELYSVNHVKRQALKSRLLAELD
jgi:Bacterial regulatory helix-turn-helix protein, lysR family